MVKTDAQKAKETEKLKKYLDLVYNGGMAKTDAAKAVGMSRKGIRDVQHRYLPNSFESQLKENGFDPSNWSHGWLKSEEVSVFIRNKDGIVTYDDVRDEFIKAAKAHAPEYKRLERKKLSDPHLLIVDIADIHMGKYASETETGQRYDRKVCERRVKEGIEGLLQKASGFPIDKILLVIGNDVLHVDSPHRRTTSGTFQDTDGQWHEAYIQARELYVYLIELLLPIADVHCIFNPSNHDFMSGFMLADSVVSWFRNAKNITFDADLRHRKYFVYGRSLIGTTHGDGAPEKKLGSLMAQEAREQWSRTEFRYWYCHHKHHKIANEEVGVCIEYVRSPTSADSWHDRNAYITQPAVEAFVHSRDNGQIARLTTYV